MANVISFTDIKQTWPICDTPLWVSWDAADEWVELSTRKVKTEQVTKVIKYYTWNFNSNPAIRSMTTMGKFEVIFFSFICCDSPLPSSEPWPPHSRGFYITLRHTTVGRTLLWTNDRPVAQASTWQHTDIHASGGIRTRNLSSRVAADPRLRPRGLWDRQTLHLTFKHRASCILGRFTALQRTLFIYLINKYISLSDICLTVHHWYK